VILVGTEKGDGGMTVNDKAKQLWDAQVRFSLKQYQGKQLDKKIAETIESLYSQLKTVTPNDLVEKEQLGLTVRAVLFTQPLKAELLDMIYTVASQAADLDTLKKTAIKDLLSKKSYNLFVNQLVASDTARQKGIGLTMESELYSELISDVLYHGIKDYLLDENFLVKMRGVSALVKASKWGIGKALPQLDSSIETTVKPYIQANIKRTVSLSKTFLEHELDEKRIKVIANSIWKELRTQKLATFTDSIDDETLDELIGIAEQVWEDIRTREVLMDVCSQLIEVWFETYGDQPITETLDSIGFGKEGIVSQLQAYATAIVQQAEASGYLEARIREQLEPFYRSNEFKQILDS
jgi:hypothetical protein